MPLIATKGAPTNLAEATELLRDDTKVKVAGESIRPKAGGSDQPAEGG